MDGNYTKTMEIRIDSMEHITRDIEVTKEQNRRLVRSRFICKSNNHVVTGVMDGQVAGDFRIMIMRKEAITIGCEGIATKATLSKR